MELEEIRQPRYKLTLDSNETIATRVAITTRLLDQSITQKERRNLEPIAQALTQLQLGEL